MKTENCYIARNITPNYTKHVFSPHMETKLFSLPRSKKACLSWPWAKNLHNRSTTHIWTGPSFTFRIPLYLKGKNGAFSKSTTNVQIASHYHPSIEALASIHFEYVSSIQWDALKWGVTKTFSIVVVCHHALRVLFNGDHEWHPSGKKVLCIKLQRVRKKNWKSCKNFDCGFPMILYNWFRGN